MASTLQDLLNPKTQAKMAQYENARISVAEGWRMAEKVVTASNAPTTLGETEIVDKLSRMAKSLAGKYFEQLNGTLALLDAANEA